MRLATAGVALGLVGLVLSQSIAAADGATPVTLSALSASPAAGLAGAAVTISYTVSGDTSVTAGVYSSSNQMVDSLASGVATAAGAHTLAWDEIAQGGSQLQAGSYTITLSSTDAQGNVSTQSVPFTVDPVAVADVSATTTGRYVGGIASVSYQLSGAADVTVTVKNSAGKAVQTLLNGKSEAAGTHSVSWNEDTVSGSPVSTGSYRLTVASKDAAGDVSSGSTETTLTDGTAPGSVAVAAGMQITRRMYDHWMDVAVKGNAEAQKSKGNKHPPTIVPTDPPGFQGCIKQVRTQLPSLRHVSDKSVGKDCKQLFGQLNRETMAYLIEADWYLAEAKYLGITLTKAQVEAAYLSARKAEYPTPADYRKFLHESGQTDADIHFRVRVNTLYEKLKKKLGTVSALNSQVASIYGAETFCTRTYKMDYCRVSPATS